MLFYVTPKDYLILTHSHRPTLRFCSIQLTVLLTDALLLSNLLVLSTSAPVTEMAAKSRHLCGDDTLSQYLVRIKDPKQTQVLSQLNLSNALSERTE